MHNAALDSSESTPESRAIAVLHTKKVLIALSGFIGILVIAFAVLLGWNPFDSSESKARTAINVAVEACGTNRFLLDAKVVDAKVAIDRVPGMKSVELAAVLSSRLKQVGCTVD